MAPAHSNTTMPMPRPVFLMAVLAAFLFNTPSLPIRAESPSGATLQQNCADCHSGESAEGGFDLKSLQGPLTDPDAFARWVRVVDRVAAGEMPPEDANELTAKERKQFTDSATKWIDGFQREQWRTLGRVRGRRLTNLQLERSLHELLGIDIPLANQLPEEPKTGGFNTVASGQAMSHFQLKEHLTVVDAALDEAFSRAFRGDPTERRELDGRRLSRRNPRRRTREPELIDGNAVTWAARTIFYGRLPATTARKSGWYRFTIRAKGLKPPTDRGVWCTVRTGQCVSGAPLLNWVGAIEATREFKTWSFEAWVPAGHMLEIRPGDSTLKQGRFQGGQIGTGEGGPQNVPGVAVASVIMERIQRVAPASDVKTRLFGDLKLRAGDQQNVIESASPAEDLERLLLGFAARAFRRPVEKQDIAPYIQLAKDSLEETGSLSAAIRLGYRSLLCSPRFLYLNEKPGQLDSFALASRLSYFLWSTTPDEELLRLAKQDRLQDPQMIRQQVRRMLKDPKGRRFVHDLAAQWLDLSDIDFTTPDRRLYPGFDVIVQQSMVEETENYLQDMIDRDANVSALIQSDHTFLNERLARFYQIDGVAGDSMQKVVVSKEDHRGGLLTHGSILKVTANGTNTSPVIRGVWVSERLLGERIPPPPSGVSAIEPDIRGAKTIREMLAKHKSDPSCASCHRSIDPPGFALENFDPAGRWRSKYIQVKGRRVMRGADVDPSSELPTGQHFENLNQFQRLIVKAPEKLAENVAEKLLTYGTGAPITFADRRDVAEIAERARKGNFGFRSIIEEVACSNLFQIK